MQPLSEASYLIIMCCTFLTIGALIGLKHGNPIYDITEIVWLNMPDTIKMRAFHTECWYIQDIWLEGVEQ